MIFFYFVINSIVFVFFPILMNACLAFNIFIFEITKNPDFEKWANERVILVRFITLFSSGNVELLHLLDSRYAGLEIFDAPFSPRALYVIFWGGILNIFIEDIPQLLIQVKLFFSNNKVLIIDRVLKIVSFFIRYYIP